MPKRRWRRKRKASYPACLHALHQFGRPEVPLEWQHVLRGIEGVRGERFRWRHHDTSYLRYAKIWIGKNEFLRDWALSDSCLISPRRWPDAVLPAFKYRLIPSPHEVTNVNMVTRLGMSRTEYDIYLLLIMYGLGFTVEMIAKALQMTEDGVLDGMYEAVRLLFTLPQFIIWATATNFREAIISPSLLGETALDRLAVIDDLDRNPFLVKKGVAAKIVESPTYLSYLIYGTPKRSRLSYSCRILRTVEEADGYEEDQTSRTEGQANS